jgi:hypothetical protein
MTDPNQTFAWLHAVLDKARDERGFSVTSETLWWIIGISAIAALVISFLGGYIQDLLGRL